MHHCSPGRGHRHRSRGRGLGEATPWWRLPLRLRAPLRPRTEDADPPSEISIFIGPSRRFCLPSVATSGHSRQFFHGPGTAPGGFAAGAERRPVGRYLNTELEPTLRARFSQQNVTLHPGASPSPWRDQTMCVDTGCPGSRRPHQAGRQPGAPTQAEHPGRTVAA